MFCVKFCVIGLLILFFFALLWSLQETFFYCNQHVKLQLLSTSALQCRFCVKNNEKMSDGQNIIEK